MEAGLKSAPPRVRPLERDDLEALQPIDLGYAERHSLEPAVSAASLSFYGRSGHAFVAERDAGRRVAGFVLAQAVWTGARPVVRLARLALADPDDRSAHAALVEALTKSAYDAAVYDLEALLPAGDHAAAAALEAAGYALVPQRVYARKLGSRGRSAAAPAATEASAASPGTER